MNKPEAGITEFNRRDFLKGGSVATLMAMMGGIPLIAQPAPEKPAEAKPPGPKVKVGVIGLGPRGREILDQLAVLQHAEITAICDTYKPMVNRSASKAPDAAKAEDYKAVLDNKAVEAVIIATPTHQHKDIAIAALQAGKHVYCEAPLANTLEDARAIALAAKNAVGKVFQSGLQMRCDPYRHWLMPFIRSVALGKFIMARAQWHKKQSWRATSPNAEYEKAINWRLDKAVSLGLSGEIGIHQLDQAGWFLGGLPTAVTGYGTISFWNDGREVADTVQLVVEYPADVRLAYDCTLANSFDREYEMYYGSDAAVMLRDSQAWMFKEKDAPLLGWEVYSRKDVFYKSTGIAVVPGVSGQTPPAAGGAASAFPFPPLYYALDAFLNNCADTNAASVRRTVPADKDSTAGALLSVIQNAPKWDAGYAATVLAIKAGEAIATGRRIELKREWFELA